MKSVWLYYDFEKYGLSLDQQFEDAVPRKHYEGSGTDFRERDISWGGFSDEEAERYRKALLKVAKDLRVRVRVEVV